MEWKFNNAFWKCLEVIIVDAEDGKYRECPQCKELFKVAPNCKSNPYWRFQRHKAKCKPAS